MYVDKLVAADEMSRGPGSWIAASYRPFPCVTQARSARCVLFWGRYARAVRLVPVTAGNGADCTSLLSPSVNIRRVQRCYSYRRFSKPTFAPASASDFTRASQEASYSPVPGVAQASWATDHLQAL